MMLQCRSFLLAAASCLLVDLTRGHHVIVYPGTRGDSLKVTAEFPFGMQWMYPCGGLSPTTNRTAWPVGGNGGVAIQPGWFRGHSSSLFYINMGFGADPINYSFPMTPMFRVNGPSASDDPFPGQFCLPQVPLPEGVTPKSGDPASIQIVQAHKHGAPSFSCADIVFTDDLSQVPPLTDRNCFNSTSITVQHVQVVVVSGAATTASTTTLSQSTTSSAPANSAKRLSSRFSGLMGFLMMI